VAAEVKVWTSRGAVKHGIWCEVHSLPHVFEYTLYQLTEYLDGFPYIRPLKTVTKCDMR
jgi:hypothetical protein